MDEQSNEEGINEFLECVTDEVVGGDTPWLDVVVQLKRFILALIMIVGFWVAVGVVLFTQTDFGVAVLDKLILLVGAVISFYFGKSVGEGSV